jgi:hypothetical protein
VERQKKKLKRNNYGVEDLAPEKRNLILSLDSYGKSLLAGSLLIRAAQRLSVYLLETFAMPGEHL